MQPAKLTFQSLQEITHYFSEDRVLGRGGFGVVYKGVYKNGQEIAVKILNHIEGLDDGQFRNEYENLTRLKHPNIVKLLGFCSESEKIPAEYKGKQVTAEKIHRALCFEYLHMGSLRNYLSDEHQGLDWHVRYKIIKGICVGLKYLHKGLETPIYHLDLKPDNILLDENMVPKIADFGMSKLLGNRNTEKQLSSLGGTRGYMPPEYIEDNIISKEYDVFSLGVIIMKIMMGSTGYYLVNDLEPTELTELVQKNWRDRLQKAQEYTHFEVDCQQKQIKRCMEIALNCVDKVRKSRRAIGDIVDELNKTETTYNGPVSLTKQVDDEESILEESNTQVTTSRKVEIKPSSLSGLPNEVSYTFLEEITDKFSKQREIAVGDSGVVYQGILDNGESIAVKTYTGQSQFVDDESFRRKIQLLMRINHKNLAKIICYCCETQENVVPFGGKFVLAQKKHKLLCFQYQSTGTIQKLLAGGMHGVDWDRRLKIISGICQGLHFLHEQPEPIIHLSLKPENILLDKYLEPKISGLTQSRVFSVEKRTTRTTNNNSTKTSNKDSNLYAAPEYLYQGEVTKTADIYSLGVLILAVTTAQDFTRSSTFLDMKPWTKEDALSLYPELENEGIDQVIECVRIGRRCITIQRRKRPSIGDIIQDLDSVLGECERPYESPLLEINPPRLRFTFQPNKLITTWLQLQNNTDYCVAFKLQSNRPRMYFTTLPLCGLLPGRGTWTLTLTLEKQPSPSSDRDYSLTLQSSIVGEYDELQNVRSRDMELAYLAFFSETEENENKIDVGPLKVVIEPSKGWASEPIQSMVEIVATKYSRLVLSTDVHPAEHWIITSHEGGNVCIWDYRTLELVHSFEFTERPVYSVKFIPHKNWLVAGDGNGYIHVYTITDKKQVKKLEAHARYVSSLAVHPTGSFVLSASPSDSLVKLWDWDNDWNCIRTFEGHANVIQVTFNPKDTHSFASASKNGTIKFWSCYSPRCRNMGVSAKHSIGLLCVKYFISRGRQCLISGSFDGVAEVWDMESESHVKTLSGHKGSIAAIYWDLELPMLITGSSDGTIRLWDPTTYRLKNIICFNLGEVCTIGYIRSLKRIVVGCRQGIATMEI